MLLPNSARVSRHALEAAGCFVVKDAALEFRGSSRKGPRSCVFLALFDFGTDFAIHNTRLEEDTYSTLISSASFLPHMQSVHLSQILSDASVSCLVSMYL